jgi:hypothetical protein
MHVAGEGYPDNDHVAFRDDLETIRVLGLRIAPLHEIANALAQGRLDQLAGCVGLSFDDGSDFDFHDLPHPSWGPQRGMARILEDFRTRHGVAPHATTFVIASPEARETLDRTCMIGCRWWNEDWWPEAEHSGLLAVENHGWDHNHESLAATATTAPRGTFRVESADEAETEIVQAASRIRELRGRGGDVLFAYPYGDPSEYLVKQWMRVHAERAGIAAAFGSDPEPVTAASDRWRVPRFVFRRDWQRPGELERLLRSLDLGAPAQAPEPPRVPAASLDRRRYLRAWEVNDPRHVAGALFKRHFGHEIPDYPRHFVLVYSPPPDAPDTRPAVVAYVHQRPFDEVHLGGGMVVDASAYRLMPRWLFEQVREEGGLATLVTRGSIELLGDSLASFGHVGEPRARAADLRTGYVDTGVEHLMVYWRKDLPEPERQRLIAKVAAVGPF